MDDTSEFGNDFLDYTDCWLCIEMKKHYIKLANYNSIWQSTDALRLVRCPTHTAFVIEDMAKKIAMGQPVHAHTGEIDTLGLSLRARNVLVRNRIYTVGHLATLSREELIALRGCGTGTADEIIAKLRVKQSADRSERALVG